MDHKKVLDKYNKVVAAEELLQQLGHRETQTGIELPKITVIGGQTAGKSSLVESIVGYEFLPRGTGIVTRRPLMVQLVPSHDRMWSVVDRNVQRDYEDPSRLKDAIKEATDCHPDCRHSGVSKDRLIAKIQEPFVLHLTFIDMIGLTRNPIDNQPESIVKDIEDIVRDFIKEKNTIILAVSPSTHDIANCAAVKMAKSVDKNFSRTIGVYTHLDVGLMDEEGNYTGRKDEVKRVLKQDLKGVPSEWIPVLCNSIPGEEQNQKEKDFFEKTFFPALDLGVETTKYGISHLCETLTSRLIKEINKMWPKIDGNVRRLYQQKRDELVVWKEHFDKELWDGTALKCINCYTNNFAQLISGGGNIAPIDRLWTGAQIVDIYKGTFITMMEKIDPLENMDDDRLLKLLKNHQGYNDGHFLRYESLLYVVKANIEKVIPICESCVDDVCSLLKLHACDVDTGSARENLTKWVQDTTASKIEEWRKGCTDFAKDLVAMEKRINPDHPKYKEIATELSGNNQANEETKIIRGLLEKSFKEVICIKVKDSIPKAIDLKLVKPLETMQLNEALITEFQKIQKSKGGLKRIMGITEDDEQKYAECQDFVQKLKQVVNEIDGEQ